MNAAAKYEEHVERVLKIALGLALSGYGEAVCGMTGMARAFRADITLHNVHKAYQGPRGRTLLMHAARTGDVARARFLVGRGAAVHARTRRGLTALMCACQNGHLETVRFLVEHGGAAVGAATPHDGTTALMVASRHGHVDTVRWLVEHGAPVNAATTDDGTTALMWASQNGHLETVRLLVERGGAAVGAAMTDDGYTALMWASGRGHFECVRFLVERGGAAVNAATTDDGTTALMVASQEGHLECVRFLVERGGAAVNAARTTDGYTALMLACACGHHETTVATLLQHGASTLAAQPGGRTPLHCACAATCPATVRLLLAAGADACAEGAWHDDSQPMGPRCHTTPLGIACVNGQGEVVRALLAAGSSADARLDGRGSCSSASCRFSPPGEGTAFVRFVGHRVLMEAVERCHFYSDPPHLHFSPLRLAAVHGRLGAVQALLDGGAEYCNWAVACSKGAVRELLEGHDYKNAVVAEEEEGEKEEKEGEEEEENMDGGSS
jgi:ankyrin repeat protein